MAVVLLATLRRRSVVLQAAVAGLAPVLAVAIGVAGASLAMFISEHDLHALFVVLIAAGTVGVLTGVVLGRRVATAGRSLGVMARKLGLSIKTIEKHRSSLMKKLHVRSVPELVRLAMLLDESINP